MAREEIQRQRAGGEDAGHLEAEDRGVRHCPQPRRSALLEPIAAVDHQAVSGNRLDLALAVVAPGADEADRRPIALAISRADLDRPVDARVGAIGQFDDVGSAEREQARQMEGFRRDQQVELAQRGTSGLGSS